MDTEEVQLRVPPVATFRAFGRIPPATTAASPRDYLFIFGSGLLQSISDSDPYRTRTGTGTEDDISVQHYQLVK
jgi:hypothetical protein